MTPRAILLTIRSVDPDGGPCEPTMADFRAFRAAVVARYGYPVWAEYLTDWDVA